VLNVTAPAPATPEGSSTPPTNNLLASLLSSAASRGSAKEAVGSGGRADSVRQAALGAARASCSGLYPSKWQKVTQQLVAEAETTVADSGR
jgi:hypothetical protein